MSPGHRVLAAGVFLILIFAGSTLGYMLIEGVTLADAVFMTVITISTVGYQKEFELSRTGELFTVVIILLGVGTTIYTAGAALELGIENFFGGRRRKLKMARAIEELRDHYIVCGFGRVGSHTWERIASAGAPVVVIEADPQRVEEAAEAGALVVEGDATHDEVLAEAGLASAKALVACVRSDSDNLVIVLSAKARRRDLMVLSRATDAQSESKLRLAGADRVVAPLVQGAQRLADLALQPALAEFLDLVLKGNLVEFRVEQLPLSESCPLNGASLREAGIRERSGALVLAIEDIDGRLILNPDPDVVLKPGQVVVGIGTADQVDRLERLVNGERM
ncbi:MAG: potassium channel protein [Actinomycetota bacterium]|nr:potassium channel protein [Actinomycetota bacterium]